MKGYDNILCVIPARAGSQGITDKNLRLIAGVPMVEHSIVHALDAGLNPQNIYVSSDGEEIRDYARRNGVIAHKRPSSISGPLSSTEETLLCVLSDYLSGGNLCDHVLLLQPTSPIRFKGTINRFLDFYLSSGYDSALTTTKFYDFFWKIGQSAQDPLCACSSYDPAKRPMRQKFTERDYCYFDNGNAYIVSKQAFEKTQCRLGMNVGLFPISELEGMQIDTYEDLEIFRAIFSGKIPERIGF